MLVVGMRGAGKSFWWNALQSEPQREAIEAAYSDDKAERVLKSRVSAGFGEQLQDEYPSKDAISVIVSRHKPRMLWRTVVLWAVAQPQVDLKTWKQRVDWVAQSAEEVDQLFRRASDTLGRQGRRHLVLFDALDRTSDNRQERRDILSGLLQILLELRSIPAIRAKAFVRPDMLDPEVASFPDASKVVSTQVSLDWPRNELYGLLWQYLGNAKRGADIFRERSGAIASVPWRSSKGFWQIPEPLRTDERLQQEVFGLLAAPYMGRNQRRGVSYRWLPNHLADGAMKVSPRSFLAAIREAASDESYRDPGVPLHWEAIKRGVQHASQIRVKEVSEDHPWTHQVMEPLRGLQVPAGTTEVISRWKKAQVLEKLRSPPDADQPRDVSYPGLLKELQAIGILQELEDGRLNMPDVFRVGFGVLRKGGVKALK